HNAYAGRPIRGMLCACSPPHHLVPFLSALTLASFARKAKSRGGHSMARRRPLVGVGVLLLLMGLSTCTQPSGSAPNGGAQVQILQGSTMMTTGSGYNFGSEALYAPSNPVTFTVKNVGSSTVILDASTPFSISGTNAADFGPQGSSVSIAPGSSTTFSMTFTPSILAAESAVGTVNSNAGSFSFALNGTGAASGGITLAWGPTNSSFPNPISNGGSTPGAYPSFYSTGPWPDICYFQITNTSSTGQLGVGTVTISSNTSSG